MSTVSGFFACECGKIHSLNTGGFRDALCSCGRSLLRQALHAAAGRIAAELERGAVA